MLYKDGLYMSKSGNVYKRGTNRYSFTLFDLTLVSCDNDGGLEGKGGSKRLEYMTAPGTSKLPKGAGCQSAHVLPSTKDYIAINISGSIGTGACNLSFSQTHIYAYRLHESKTFGSGGFVFDPSISTKWIKPSFGASISNVGTSAQSYQQALDILQSPSAGVSNYKKGCGGSLAVTSKGDFIGTLGLGTPGFGFDFSP